MKPGGKQKVQTYSSWRERKKLKKRMNEKKLLEQMKATKIFNQKKVFDAPENDQNDDTEPTSHHDPSIPSSTNKMWNKLTTLSVAIPGSILTNAQSHELRAYLAGQIARSCGIFCVDEIVVFDEAAQLTKQEINSYNEGNETGKNCNLSLARFLQYVECPQYLRKSLFPFSKDLRYAGLLNPLDSPHHMRMDDLSIPYREGVVLNKPIKETKGALCDAGLRKEVRVNESLEPGIRLTIKLDDQDLNRKTLQGKVIGPRVPKEEGGIYWGYTVRLACSLSEVFTESPFEGGYNLTIGTSERGSNIDSTHFPSPDEAKRHVLIVFGGVKGLETCVENDEKLNLEDPSLLFDFYLNTCPLQGSGTIRTEEAILISLSSLRTKLERKKKK